MAREFIVLAAKLLLTSAWKVEKNAAVRNCCRFFRSWVQCINQWISLFARIITASVEFQGRDQQRFIQYLGKGASREIEIRTRGQPGVSSSGHFLHAWGMWRVWECMCTPLHGSTWCTVPYLPFVRVKYALDKNSQCRYSVVSDCCSALYSYSFVAHCQWSCSVMQSRQTRSSMNQVLSGTCDQHSQLSSVLSVRLWPLQGEGSRSSPTCTTPVCSLTADYCRRPVTCALSTHYVLHTSNHHDLSDPCFASLSHALYRQGTNIHSQNATKSVESVWFRPKPNFTNFTQSIFRCHILGNAAKCWASNCMLQVIF